MRDSKRQDCGYVKVKGDRHFEFERAKGKNVEIRETRIVQKRYGGSSGRYLVVIRGY